MLVVATLAILVGFAIMFLITVNQVNDRVDEVNRQIDRSVEQLRTDVRRELDARIPPGSAGVGTVPTTPTPVVAPRASTLSSRCSSRGREAIG